MQPELLARRRVLRLTLQRYVEADREWHTALLEAKGWFPEGALPSAASIGNPGSRIRRGYEARMRALTQFEAARLKLDAARLRFATRARNDASAHSAFICIELPDGS